MGESVTRDGTDDLSLLVGVALSMLAVLIIFAFVVCFCLHRRNVILKQNLSVRGHAEGTRVDAADATRDEAVRETANFIGDGQGFGVRDSSIHLSDEGRQRIANPQLSGEAANMQQRDNGDVKTHGFIGDDSQPNLVSAHSLAVEAMYDDGNRTVGASIVTKGAI